MSDLSKELETFAARIGSSDDMELNQASEYVIAGKCAHHHEPTFHLFEAVFNSWRDVPMRRTFFHFQGREFTGDMAENFLTIFPKFAEESKLLLARSYAMGIVVNSHPEYGMSMQVDNGPDDESDDGWCLNAVGFNDFTDAVNKELSKILADEDTIAQIFHYLKRNGALAVGQSSGATAFAMNSDGSDKFAAGVNGMIWGAIQHTLWVTGVCLYLAGAEKGKHMAFINQVGQQ